MEWNDLKFVLAVARNGSFAEAGRRLAVDPTTVSRRILAVERSLGRPLFTRTPDGLSCTNTGETVVMSAVRVEMEMCRLQDEVSETSFASETVRITAVPMIVNRLLAPALACVPVGSLPRVEFVAGSRNLSFFKREADIALRFGLPDQGPAVTRLLANIGYAAYASRTATQESPWIVYGDELRHLPHSQWSTAIAATQGSARVAFNDAEGVIAAARAGIGRALLPCFAADGEGDLVRIGEVVLSRELWLAVHQDQRSQAHTRAVVDWIDSICAQLSKAR
jgi:DNA-binding transcriptional LysR family regulator